MVMMNCYFWVPTWQRIDVSAGAPTLIETFHFRHVFGLNMAELIGKIDHFGNQIP
jgi:hypothetical protein